MIAKASISVVRGDHRGRQLKSVLADFAGCEMDWMEQHTTLLKSDTHSRVGLFQLEDELCYLKFYQSKSAGQKFLFRLGYSRAMHSFNAAEKLLESNVSVPAPLSVLRLSSGMMLMTEGLSAALDLKAAWQGGLEEQQRNLMMENAGSAIARLHGSGYYHGDLKWSNLLWIGSEFYLVDLESVGTAISNPGEKSFAVRHARDLARFIVNAEDLGISPEYFEVFFTRYLGEMKLSRERVIQAVMPPLQQLRKRHEQKYGKRGHRILGEIVK